jgi:Domain of unknown function (DUF4340)
MKFKSTALLFLVFAVLGGYVYFTEYRGKEERQKQEENKKKLFSVEPKDITEISLAYPDRTITGVRKGEKQWQITSPAGLDADSDEWEQLASNVPKIEREDTVAQNVPDAAQFGLKDPVVKVSAKTKDGKTLEVLFGGENPKKSHNYAKLAGNNDVFLTTSNWSKTFTKTASDLRNKKVLEFEPDDIDNVKIVDGSKELEVQKAGDDWQLKKPIDTKADASDISTFTSAIKFARASTFPEPAVDAKTAGLDSPALKITLHDGKAKADRTLLIGKTSDKDKYYARDASRDVIFVIDRAIPENARKPLFDWRDKSIAKLDREKADKIEIQHGADMVTLVKDASDWKLADGKKAQWDKVSGMLNALDFEKAKDIVDMPKAPSAYGLDKPLIQVVFRNGANQLLRIDFGKDSTMPAGIYLKTSESPAVKVVSKDVSDKFNVKADDLVEAPEKPKP